MSNNALALSAADDREKSERARLDAERAIQRIHDTARRIRRMTDVYVERLEGTVVRMEKR